MIPDNFLIFFAKKLIPIHERYSGEFIATESMILYIVFPIYLKHVFVG